MPRSRIRRPRNPNRTAIYTLVAIVGAIVVITLLRGLALVLTDYLWFRSLYLASVWRKIVGIKILLTLVFFAVFFVALYVNMVIADRLAPRVRPPSYEDEFLERYHAIVGPRIGAVRLGVAVVFALIAASGAASQWNEWILFSHAKSFGVADAQFGRDVGFYVFRLPFLTYVANWTFAALVTIVFVVAVAHFLNGGIRTRVPAETSRLTGPVKAHLSVLLALLALVKLWTYWLDRFRLTTSERGFVNGATYADVNAKLPAIHLLMVITAFSFVLLAVNVRRRGSGLLVVTVGLWALVSIVAGEIYPAFVQRFRVEPAESRREQPYIARNIQATRLAYGIVPGVDVDTTLYDYSGAVSASDIRAASDMMRSARVVDPQSVFKTFQSLQGLRDFYAFANNGSDKASLDVDQYVINGVPTQVVIGARVLATESQSSFERKHIAYTHGIGVVVSSSSQVNSQGVPEFLVSGVPATITPPTPAFVLDQSQIYIGEDMGGYAIVGASRPEIDYIDKDNNEVNTEYTGSGGVSIGSFPRRVMFALRFGDINPLISSYLTGRSRVIYVRDVRERVEKVAPFIRWDSDPYPVISNGRIVYIVDGYTTSNRYPNAQRADLDEAKLPDKSGLKTSLNYVRNSVKAVVDAYDGTVTLYKYDDTDPIVRAYASAFPALFHELGELPRDLESHLRYPLDLFRVQTAMLARYHVDDARDFHGKLQWWSIAQDPGRLVAKKTDTNATQQNATVAQPKEQQPVSPYYYQVRLPGESSLSYVAQRSFVPYAEAASTTSGSSNNTTKQNLTSMIFARNEVGRAPRLRVIEMPGDRLPAGPAIFTGQANTLPDISKEISLLDAQGSEVSFGDLLAYPVGRSILYVLPLYVTGEKADRTATTQVPRLSRVIVGFGANADQLAIAPSLPEALAELFDQSFTDVFGATAPSPTARPTTTPTATSSDPRVQELLKSIQAKYVEADDALRASDLRRYADAQDAIRKLFAELTSLVGTK